jgi:predicted adenylyl cyclase CyaB
MHCIEIELRFEILNPSELPAFLAGLTKLSTKRIVDVYLDTNTIDLLKKGVYIRIRDGKKLDIKFNRECLYNPSLELQAHCEEYSFIIPLHEYDVDDFNSIVKTVGLLPVSRPNFEGFTEINHLIPHRTVDKVRTSYATGIFTVVIDEVVGLGTFLEIERVATNTDDIEVIKEQMQSILLPLSLKPLQTGYDSLVLRKQNFDEYLQGRFILDEDKRLRKQA